jgi:formylglycine-generating enzyme required for sulfatase activity
MAWSAALMVVAVGLKAADKTYPLWDGKESQAEYAKRAGIKDVEVTLDLGSNVTMKLILIPAGKFVMGANKDPKEVPGPYKPSPAHEVTITRPFYMAVTELTQAQYERIMGRSDNFKRAVGMDVDTAIALIKGEERDYTPEPNLPADDLYGTRPDEFVKEASRKLGRTILLPTEAQWECAYRAGTTGDFFCAAESLPDYAWFGGAGAKQYGDGVKPVALKKPNPWGLYDMPGNALETCADSISNYPAEPQTDPMVVKGTDHIIRGGYFGNAASWCTAWHRKDVPLDYRFDVFVRWKGRYPAEGVRVVMPVE